MLHQALPNSQMQVFCIWYWGLRAFWAPSRTAAGQVEQRSSSSGSQRLECLQKASACTQLSQVHHRPLPTRLAGGQPPPAWPFHKYTADY